MVGTVPNYAQDARNASFTNALLASLAGSTPEADLSTQYLVIRPTNLLGMLAGVPLPQVATPDPQPTQAAQPLVFGVDTQYTGPSNAMTQWMHATDNFPQVHTSPVASVPTADVQATTVTQTAPQPKIATQVATPVTRIGPVQQVGNNPVMTFGNGNYVIPNTEYTAGGITIDPVMYGEDNGGLQHADMNILHQTSPATFGQALAFANLMQGHRGLSGGIGDMTRTMQDIDKSNAYQAQGLVSDRVQDLIGQGYGVNEARYLALTEYGLANGLDRMAIGATMPEYAKQADEEAKRQIDMAASMGGPYTSRGAFGYNPLGIQAIETNSDGSTNIIANGQRINQVPIDYLQNGVYGAIKGDGTGAINAAKHLASGAKDYATNAAKIADIDKLAISIANGGSGGKGLSLADRLLLAERKNALAMERDAAKQGAKTGVATGIAWEF